MWNLKFIDCCIKTFGQLGLKIRLISLEDDDR